MLKKQDMTPGRVVELLPKLKNGVPKVMFGDDNFPQEPDPDSLTVSAGHEFGAGSWEVFPGERLEIVEGPKRRSGGANCAKVKTLPDGNVGMIFWCQLRVSAKLIP